LKKKLSLKIKLNLEDMTVEKKSKEDQEVVKLEEELKPNLHLIEGKRSRERLGLGVSPRGKLGTAEKKKKSKKFEKKVDTIRKLFEIKSVEVPSPLPARGQITLLDFFKCTNFAVQVAKPCLKFVTNRRAENELEKGWERKELPGLAAQSCAEEDLTNQARASRQDQTDSFQSR
jgi:hypothetical protein